MSCLIRTAEDHELILVHRLMREAFEEYRDRLNPPSGALREEVEDIRNKIAGRGGAVIAWDGKEPLGSAQYYYEESYMYIGRVSVSGKARGRGIGQELMTCLENMARNRQVSEARIEVRLSLPGNIAFYEKRGYEVVEMLEYPNKTDAWYVMKKVLQP
ncbi:GNAT family N-acetyltransferase [Cohnella faecalis]|uniref:GNAT family N-acetyltransferase n=1 Tax=Cohnella faecalis TaxID=2315694 RepID=A0A398CX24_9BACL|nr:GNAT family N-acetyltransferase [Cohnella faecalis]RIE03554.1 GNAT family N-acetyltransferase [Cohnella faecalis]